MFGSIIRAVFCRGRVLYPFTALKHLDFPHRKEHVSSLDCVWVASEVKRRKLELSWRIEEDTALRAVSPPSVYLLKVIPTHLPLMHRRRCFLFPHQILSRENGSKGGNGRNDKKLA